MLLTLQVIFALAVTLSLLGLAAYAARRWGPPGLIVNRSSGERRLKVVETLTLDPNRRLVLVRLDQEERLLLLGEGRLLETRGAPAAGQDCAVKPGAAPR